MAASIRILIVDDSAVIRYGLRKMLSRDPLLEVVGEAADGIEAVELSRSLRPDVVLLDIVLPRQNGLDALRDIMASCPTRVVVLSSPRRAGSRVALDSLARGAVDFVAKPAREHGGGLWAIEDELIGKVKAAAAARIPRARPTLETLATTTSASRASRVVIPQRPVSPAGGYRTASGVIVIGTSTGGPGALSEIVPRLPRDLPFGVIVVQHMPAGFTRTLADRLDQIGPVRVKEAEAGDKVEPGLVLVAPGGRGLSITHERAIELSDDAPTNRVRPSVDVAMTSAARAFGQKTVGVLLTGMGSDGSSGAAAIRRVYGKVLAEDASTCIVFGMSRVAIEAGEVDLVLPRHRIVDELLALVG